MSMKRYMMLLIMVVFAIGACVAIYAQETDPTKEKIRLQWKWEKGKTYRYKMTEEMKQKISGAPEGNMETSKNQVVVISQKVTGVDDKGVATLELKFESIKVEMNIPMLGKITFDSTKEEDLKKTKGIPELAALAAMMGKPFIMKISKDGEVVEVKGFSKLAEGVLKNNPMATQLKDTYSDESMKKEFQQSYGYTQLPKEGVAIGDSWETSQEMLPTSLLRAVKAKGKNTYKGNETIGERECIRIDTQMDIPVSINPNNPYHKMFDAKYELTPRTTVSYFDLKEGIIVKQEVKMKMKGTLTSKPGEEKIKMKLEQEITMKMELMDREFSPTVTLVPEGDAFVLANGEEVRLIGIKAPDEGEPGYDECRLFLEKMILGKEVRFQREPYDRDNRNRLLRYVYVDDIFVNAEMIKNGYATVRFYLPERHKGRYKDDFIALQQEAEQSKKGLWAKGGIFQPSKITPVSEAPEEDVILWRDAAKYYGKIKTVEGKIITTHNTGWMCFLNFHRNYKKHFTAAILADDYDKFPSRPEKYYRNKKVRVRGLIQKYEGKPQIILKDPKQIEIIE